MKPLCPCPDCAARAARQNPPTRRQTFSASGRSVSTTMATGDRIQYATRHDHTRQASQLARATLREALAAAEPDLGTRLWMERVRVTARLKREGWLD